MANEIKKALEEAVQTAEAENGETQLTGRMKKLLARKKNLQRKKHNPNQVKR